MFITYSDPVLAIEDIESWNDTQILNIKLKRRRQSYKTEIKLSLEDAKKLQQQLNELLK
jgi:hypothetical protein